MRQKFCWIIILLVWSFTVQAIASEITIWDNQAGGSKAWHKNLNEDEEVEPGALDTNPWDLEGMFFDGTDLSIVGEWNFVGRSDDIGSGDIFISTSGYALYGDTVPEFKYASDDTILNNFGYTYVFDVDWEHFVEDTNEADNILGTGSYDLVIIDSNTHLNAANEDGLAKGSPASYAWGGTYKRSGTFTFSIAGNTGFEGGTHYMVSGFDMSGIADNGFIAHFTQECGNDVIMGQVPEPATMLLLGVGLLGIGAIGRRLPLKAA